MNMFKKMAFPVALVSALVFLISACTQQPSAPAMPKRIVDLSPIISEDLPLRAVGRKFLTDFGYRERTTFEHKITEEPFYAASSPPARTDRACAPAPASNPSSAA